MKRIAILISGRGSNMQALILAAQLWPQGVAEIAVVVSNEANAAGLDFAAQHGIATYVLPHRAYKSRADFDAALAAYLQAQHIDWVVLAGFMRILSESFVQTFYPRLVNIHPSLLPSFIGLHTHQQALTAGVTLHGATVHLVSPQLDSGPIVMQGAVPVQVGDDEAALAARVLAVEHMIYPKAVYQLISCPHTIMQNRVVFEKPVQQVFFQP